ncbi:MAG: Gfo/Idh/MocA family oxidoreductase, partial [Verrucomicrobiae bacterium]|nr:Gfo/Idh/MocA family oxidoreductase [Verrucomicrobiae bacterium]
MAKEDTNYGLEANSEIKEIAAPVFDYQPLKPESFRPKIGLIGCGGITTNHLNAYRQDKLEVAAFCDLNADSAEKRRKEFYPEATCYTDYRQLLDRGDIEVVDIALHPGPRAAVIEAALHAGKHVLSQKPFALDLDVAEKLVALADEKGLKLAVNQNGRWAPYVRYIQLAIDAGLIGEIHVVNIFLNWDHTWI